MNEQKAEINIDCDECSDMENNYNQIQESTPELVI